MIDKNSDKKSNQDYNKSNTRKGEYIDQTIRIESECRVYIE